MKRTYKGIVLKRGDAVVCHSQGMRGNVIKVINGGATVDVMLLDGEIVRRHASFWSHAA